ncbi:MAG: ferrochelatase, partial [Nitrospinaceae bacterium]
MSSAMGETSPPRTAVILLAHGAPEAVADIPKYLMNIRGGRVSSAAVLKEVTQRYQKIGGSSPLRAITQAQAEALEQFLNQDGHGFRVYFGMRTWSPYIRDVVLQAVADGAERLIAICLAPQYSEWSTERYWKAFLDALGECPADTRFDYVTSWAAHPCLIDALAARYTAAVQKMEAEGVETFDTIFTVHSIPEGPQGPQKEPYVHDYNRTVRALVDRVQPAAWHQAYQSQGMIPVPWLTPTVEDTLDRIAEAGGAAALLIPVGFVSDHIEVL